MCFATFRVRHWAGSGGLNTTLLSSANGVNFSIVAVLQPQQLGATTLPLNTTISARFLAVRHLVK